MPTRLSGFIVAGLLLVLPALGLSGHVGPREWTVLVCVALLWAVSGPLLHLAMSWIAPAAPPRRVFWSTGMVFGAACAVVALSISRDALRDPVSAGLAALAIAAAWSLFDLFAMAMWRYGRLAAPPRVLTTSLAFWLGVVALALAVAANLLPEPVLGAIAMLFGLPAGLLLVFGAGFEIARAADRRRRAEEEDLDAMVRAAARRGPRRPRTVSGMLVLVPAIARLIGRRGTGTGP